jgi:hypothetical protein
VEILLADWIPRKIVASPAQLTEAPSLLRAFIRFCHAERQIRAALTDDTLAAVDEWEPEYQRVIRSPRPQGPMALLAAMGAFGDEKPWEDEPFEQLWLESLAEEVGGQDALDSLDGTPLPDEEFAWADVPADVRDRVREVLAACDRCSDDLFGAEYRTAARRLLARAAPGLPALRTTANPKAIAAAVCWVIGKGNQRFGRTDGELRVKDLMSYFSLTQSSISERGLQVMRAAGIPAAYAYPQVHLGSPDLLVSARRKTIIELRDHHRSRMSGQR